MKRFIYLFSALLCFWIEGWSQAVRSFQKEKNRIVFEMANGELQLYPLSSNTIRVKFVKQPLEMKIPEWIYINNETEDAFTVKDGKKAVSVKLAGITVQVDKATGLITFLSPDGNPVLQEAGRQLTPSSIQGVDTYCATQKFYSPEDEHLFGLGQFQDGWLDVRGLTRRLTQVNTQIAIPMYVSNKKYGVLWNNYGLTDFNPAEEVVELLPFRKESEAKEVDVTSTEGGKKEMRENYIFTSDLMIPAKGRYSILLDVGQTMARKYHLRIGNKTIFDMENTWLPPTTSTIVELEAGSYNVVAELEKNDKPKVFFKKVDNETVLRSPVAECVDYTVFCGGADDVITSYRQLTGRVPMFPDWALGYIHCRERFHNQQELLETAAQFRKDRLPMDIIVQDWQYWGRYGWNAMKFDEKDYPNPTEMVNKLHEQDMRLMVSVWSKVDPASEVGKAMAQQGYFIPGTSWVDFFNPKAASFYWKNFSRGLLKHGIDAWWQDATEPENDDLLGRKVADGKIPGEVFRNSYPILVNKTVYEGLRRDAPEKRSMILTRSGFPGMQRYATATWSGDVGSDWNTLRRQIVSGLSMSVSGLPWWTYDAGGFFRPYDQYTNQAYKECMMRWVQTSVFLPLMRVHGYGSNTEFWNYGAEVTALARQILATRYRLAPYLYSENANISFNNGTFLRPLVMDFANDTTAILQKYQYMFGPSLLVAPIVEEGAKEWNVYFPATKGGWYDFWSDKYVADKGWRNVSASKSHIPVYVKAGSILPLADGTPQTMNEAYKEDWIIKVFAGANGSYMLYEDEGTNYNYEKGQFSNIHMDWNDKKKKLTVGERKGSFQGMIEKRPIRVLLISENGIEEQKLSYEGEKIVIRF